MHQHRSVLSPGTSRKTSIWSPVVHCGNCYSDPAVETKTLELCQCISNTQYCPLSQQWVFTGSTSWSQRGKVEDKQIRLPHVILPYWEDFPRFPKIGLYVMIYPFSLLSQQPGFPSLTYSSGLFQSASLDYCVGLISLLTRPTINPVISYPLPTPCLTPFSYAPHPLARTPYSIDSCQLLHSLPLTPWCLQSPLDP
jgi:hypothetical protein